MRPCPVANLTPMGNRSMPVPAVRLLIAIGIVVGVVGAEGLAIAVHQVLVRDAIHRAWLSGRSIDLTWCFRPGSASREDRWRASVSEVFVGGVCAEAEITRPKIVGVRQHYSANLKRKWRNRHGDQMFT